VLVERPGDLVSRAEIIEAVWPGTAVEDSSLNAQVAALRRILDQLRLQQRLQQPRAPVADQDPPPPEAVPPHAHQ
jgi:DNA-binding response OmpR family regulator